MRTLLCAAAAITLSLLTACGSGSGTAAPATIRVVNDTPNTIDLNLNGLTEVSNTASQGTSGYVSVTPSTYTLSISNVGGQQTGSATTVGLGTGQNYTALAYQRGNNIYPAVFADNQAIPSAGFSSLDVANVSNDAGPLDIYLVPHGSSLANYQPTFSSVQGLSTATTFASTAPASGSTAAIAWDVVVTKAGSTSDVRLTLSNPDFASAQPYTLGLTATAGGGLVNAVLIPQGQTNAVFLPSTQARVRVLSALPTPASPAAPPTVSVQVGTTTTLSTAFTPVPTQYQLVPAKSTITGISITTSADSVTYVTAPITTALPTTAFAAGGDYTILIYGSGGVNGAPAAIVLTDDNEVVPNYARVRFINAAATGNAGLSTLYASVQGALNVTYPTPSTDTAYYAYASVKPTSSANIDIIGAGYSGGPISEQFTSGSVYTILVYSPTSPAFFVQDR